MSKQFQNLFPRPNPPPEREGKLNSRIDQITEQQFRFPPPFGRGCRGRGILLALTTFIITACTTAPVYDEQGREVVTRNTEKFQFSVPEGWVKIYSPTGYVYLTKDGPQLQRIGFERAPLDNAFPRLRKREQHKITADIDLITLSERYVANIKSGSLENIEILSAGQSQLDGRPAFEKLMQYTDSSGVRYRVKAYGLVNENGFYEVYYSAPVLYFYDRDIITFEEVLATYQIIIETDDKVSN